MDTMTIPLKSCKHNSYEAQTPTFTTDPTMGSRAILLTGGITASLVKFFTEHQLNIFVPDP